MDFELNRKILFSTEIKHKSLYSWCLQELDANGEKIGGEQIPWAWTNRFIATNFRYGVNLNGKLENSSRISPITFPHGKSNKNKKLKISETESINLPLTSDGNETNYSMFGTERPIKDINLSIHKDIDERCSVWGCPSYVAEIDFCDMEQPDTIQFNLFIHPDKFNKIVELIKYNNISKILFTAKEVAGFYSEWSPSISTNKIKVLCEDDDHKVETTEKSKMAITQKENLPRLGEVSEFNLTVIQNENNELTLTNNGDKNSEIISYPNTRKVEDIFNAVNKIGEQVKYIYWTVLIIAVYVFIKF
jgi:hypothetical protein